MMRFASNITPIHVFIGFSLLLLGELTVGFHTGDKDGKITAYNLHYWLELFVGLALVWATLHHAITKKHIVSVNLSVFLGLYMTVELICFGIYYTNSNWGSTPNPKKATLKMVNLKDTTQTRFDYLLLAQKDTALGYTLAPNVQVEASVYLDTDTIYKVIYETDSLSRRITHSTDSATKQYHAVFMGCSYTFGEGLSDSTYLPACLESAYPNVETYNYGRGGYGTQHMYSLLSNLNVSTQLTESTGIGIYTYIDAHAVRTIGPISKGWLRDSPYYTLENNQLSYQGKFRDRNVTSLLVWYAQRSFLAKVLKYEPYQVGEQTHRLIAKLIEESYFKFHQQFPRDKFYVLIYPLQKAEFRKYLKNKEIYILDYTQLWKPTQYADYILRPNYEGHPNQKAINKIAEKLMLDLEQTQAFHRMNN